jgi:hypothetical protein
MCCILFSLFVVLLRGIDGNYSKEIVEKLVELQSSESTKSGCFRENSKMSTDDIFGNKSVVTLVSPPRIIATIELTKAALKLPFGDIVETGVYAGGTAAIMLEVMKQHAKSQCNTKFFAFDSFTGLPDRDVKDGNFGASGGKGDFACGEEGFTQNLKDAKVWNESTIIISKGWFSETVPKSPVQKIAFLRLDGDLYASTRDAIQGLYSKVVPGGFIYVDDYGSFEGCRRAIDEYRTTHRIFEPLHFIREDNEVVQIRFEAVWWQKSHHRRER